MHMFVVPGVALLAAMSPGPDFMIVSQYALGNQRRNALLATLGVGTGLVFHISYCLLGIAAMIAHSPILLKCIQYFGAAYLMYLGLTSFFRPHSLKAQNHSQPSKKAFISGFLTNFLNPKCTLFMLSIFTFVIKPSTPLSLEMMYSLEIILITIGWFAITAYILTTPTLQTLLKHVHAKIHLVTGCALMVLSLVILLE